MFYLIDKPVWMTSFDVIRILRKKLQIKKMGHIGTLDPLASGLLLIATEQSTKLLPLINSNKKTYQFIVNLNGTSESLDAWEEIKSIDILNRKTPKKEYLMQVLSSQTEQIPPKFSALHINGKRAYELARLWENFTIPKRKITVSNVEILDLKKDTAHIRITISSGWYIRSFAPIVGECYGINWGYISFLRREQIYIQENIFLDESQAQDLDNFNPENNISEKTLFPNFLHISSNNKKIQNILQNGIVPQDLEKILQMHPKEEQYILLVFPDSSSLLQKKNNTIQIVRNNIISSSHKNHTK